MAFGRVLKDVAAQFVGPALVAKGAGAGCGLPGRVPSRVGLAPAAAFDVAPAFAAKSAEELLSDDGFLEEIGAESRGFVEDWCSPPPATAAFAARPLTARPYPRRLSELSVELTMNSAVAR